MNYPNEIRNKAIILLSKADKRTFTDPILGELFGGLSKQTVNHIRKRDWNKYKLPLFIGEKIPTLEQEAVAERDELIKKEYKEGKGLTFLGRKYGVSKQRIEQIVKSN